MDNPAASADVIPSLRRVFVCNDRRWRLRKLPNDRWFWMHCTIHTTPYYPLSTAITLAIAAGAIAFNGRIQGDGIRAGIAFIAIVIIIELPRKLPGILSDCYKPPHTEYRWAPLPTNRCQSRLL